MARRGQQTGLLSLVIGLLSTSAEIAADDGSRPGAGAAPRSLMALVQPKCSRQKSAPVHGQLQQLKVNSRDSWQFDLEDAGCTYALWERPHTAGCLQGKWVVLMGASQTNIWTTQLANSLVERAVLTKQDHFIIDGVFTQMIDVVIEMDTDGNSGRVVYKNVLRDVRAPSGHRVGAHTTERDNEVLAKVFAQASHGRTESRPIGPGIGNYSGTLPEHTGKLIRITNFFAEYWDNVDVGLAAIKQAQLGWQHAEVTLAVSIGLWYINSLHCGLANAWCATRPKLGKLTLDGLVQKYKDDMAATLPKLQEFCSVGGRAGALGCAITSIDHCQFMQGAIWHMIYDAVKQGMAPISTPLLRFVDLWTFTLEIPEDCLGGHQSPMSTLWTWQVLLSGICRDGKHNFPAAKGTLAQFRGETCRAAEVVKKCPNPKAKGFHYQWECALSELCMVEAIEPPESLKPIEISTVPVHVDLDKASHVAPQTTWQSSWRDTASGIPFRLFFVLLALLAAFLSHCFYDKFQDWNKDSREAKPERAAKVADDPAQKPEEKAALIDEETQKKAADQPKAAPDRFAFGLARCIASMHVVSGHLYAKSAIADFPAFGFGFTWVPWFFMLSGFILYSAQERSRKEEGILDYVLRRAVAIYPLYCVALVVAFLIAKSESKAPGPLVLVLQAWLVHAWVPAVTEHTLNMQCWFLCCLVFYWFLFRPLFNWISKMTVCTVVFVMVFLYLLPWLVVFVVPPLVFQQDMYWYQDHIFGRSFGYLGVDTVDFWVVFIKFHPLTFIHIFVLGMLLCKLRNSFDEEAAENKLVGWLMEFMAPLGYVGVGLVFCSHWTYARLPAAKLSGRLSVLLPFQSMILLGLAGLPKYKPKVAEWASNFNFLESYSYAVYVNQFICWHLWPTFKVGWLFFVFLAGVATVAVHLIQKPAEALLRQRLKQANQLILLIMPFIIMILLLVLYYLIPDPELKTNLPAITKIDKRLSDVRLPIRSEDSSDGSVLINPSLLFRGENEVIFVARRHRRSHKRTRDGCRYNNTDVTCMDETWHSDIVVGTKFVRWSEWNKWIDAGAIPAFPRLHRWTGLVTGKGQPWTRLCVREHYSEKNQTLIRLIVTGPEDPKVFQLADGPSGPVELAFSSYPPLGRHGCESGKAVQQMYFATGVDVLQPDRQTAALHLKCGTDSRAEKNWIPFKRKGELYFVYSVLPHVVMKVNRDGTCGGKVYSNYGPLTKLQAKNPGFFFSGSAQAVFINDTEATPQLPRPHYLALFHIKDPRTGRYAHFAYRFNPDPPFQILQVSAQLPLRAARTDEGGAGIAFASGLGIRDRQVVVSYAAGDLESRALVMTLWKLDDLFNPDRSEEVTEAATSVPAPQDAFLSFRIATALVITGCFACPFILLCVCAKRKEATTTNTTS